MLSTYWNVVISLVCLTSTVSVPESPQVPARCRPGQCEIVLKEVVTLKDRNPPLIPDFSLLVVTDRLGRFYTAANTRDRVLVFDRHGQVEAVIGQRGSGPGQFQRISRVLTGPAGDPLVYDLRLAKLTTIGPRLELGREIPAPYAPAFVLRDGRLVVAQQIPTPDLIGHPIHIIDAEGRVVRSFGADTPESRPDLELLNKRVVAPASDGTVWAVPPGRYVLDRWAPDSGTRLARCVVRSPWFKESHAVPPPGTRPMPIIEALWETNGLIWVLIRDADSNWTYVPVPPETPYEPARNDRTYDWVLETVAPLTGDVIATRRFDKALWGRAPSPLVASQRRSGSGTATEYTVWQPELRRKEQ